MEEASGTMITRAIDYLRTTRGMELLSLILDAIGLVLISIPLWFFTPPIKLTPFLGDGIHFGHSEIESAINKILDSFGLLSYMRIGLVILLLNMGLKYCLMMRKIPTEERR